MTNLKARATPGSNTNTEEPIEPPTEPTQNAAEPPIEPPIEPTQNAAEPPIEPPIEPTLNDAEPTHNSSEPTVNAADGDEPPDHNVNEDGVQSDVESSESEECYVMLMFCFGYMLRSSNFSLILFVLAE
ncbi:hypothetical protein A4A49_34088 [Nicotiana attenuata]|uniref:Uncharacterized protein n=1 Tax=Nicotiana attenuata TaxID=49451 RepID=A0A1J6J424_NICAT|nr:hypothetical protein A4A49_34088 [Nicotiana attenuata]